jgi:hypothetical protein
VIPPQTNGYFLPGVGGVSKLWLAEVAEDVAEFAGWSAPPQAVRRIANTAKVENILMVEF